MKTVEEYGEIIELVLWNLSFNIPIQQTLKGYKLSKEDIDFITNELSDSNN
jgi:hypothetical protein